MKENYNNFETEPNLIVSSDALSHSNPNNENDDFLQQKILTSPSYNSSVKDFSIKQKEILPFSKYKNVMIKRTVQVENDPINSPFRAKSTEKTHNKTLNKSK